MKINGKFTAIATLLVLLIGLGVYVLFEKAEAPESPGVSEEKGLETELLKNIQLDPNDLPKNVGDSVVKDGYTITKEEVPAPAILQPKKNLPTYDIIPKRPSTVDVAAYDVLVKKLQTVISMIQKGDRVDDALLDVALYNNMLGNSEKAVEIWRYMNANSPKQIQPVTNLAQYYMGKGNFPEAEKWFLKAISNEPKFLQSYQDLSEIYKTQKRFDEAVALLKKGAVADPASHSLHVSLAQLYVSIGKGEDAKQEYITAISIARKSGNEQLIRALEEDLAQVK
jgi:tetratricopeptide (TPR) repeat protein